VPGLLFMLNIGKMVDEAMRSLCFQTNPGHPVVISDALTGNFERFLFESFRRAKKTKSFLRSLEKMNPERRGTK
jgi:hypothetical protein